MHCWRLGVKVVKSRKFVRLHFVRIFLQEETSPNELIHVVPRTSEVSKTPDEKEVAPKKRELRIAAFFLEQKRKEIKKCFFVDKHF
jgi:hypothetical protein